MNKERDSSKVAAAATNDVVMPSVHELDPACPTAVETVVSASMHIATDVTDDDITKHVPPKSDAVGTAVGVTATTNTPTVTGVDAVEQRIELSVEQQQQVCIAVTDVAAAREEVSATAGAAFGVGESDPAFKAVHDNGLVHPQIDRIYEPQREMAGTTSHHHTRNQVSRCHIFFSQAC
jgi:hypothetical protein